MSQDKEKIVDVKITKDGKEETKKIEEPILASTSSSTESCILFETRGYCVTHKYLLRVG
jgi:hypothetical protein